MRPEDVMNPIYGGNLSLAWASALDRCWHAKGQVLAPGIVGFDASQDNAQSIESTGIRMALEEFLAPIGTRAIPQSPIESVAGTIFPESIWRRCNGDPDRLYKSYNDMWPRVGRCPLNRRGTYFRRLTAFGDDVRNGNQLRKIAEVWGKGVHRLSALQAAVFDPAKDHKAARRLGFPCLQHVVFQPIGTNGTDGLSVIAFYANQLLIDKAYGNYLGLYRLGKFMADQMGLELRNVICFAACLKLGKRSKKDTDLFTMEVARAAHVAKR